MLPFQKYPIDAKHIRSRSSRPVGSIVHRMHCHGMILFNNALSPCGVHEQAACRFAYAAILRQDSAQASQAATHSSMSPIRLQSLAHSAQISAHSLQVCL